MGEHRPLEINDARGKCSSPQAGEAPLPLPRGFGGAPVTPASATVALAGASAAPTISFAEDPATGASTPTAGAPSAAASAARGDGDGGFHLLGGGLPPPMMSHWCRRGGGSPCCSRRRYSSSCCSRCSHRLILLSFTCAARSYSRRCVARAAARAWGIGGSDCAVSTVSVKDHH
jgi:hypothetical protein